MERAWTRRGRKLSACSRRFCLSGGRLGRNRRETQIHTNDISVDLGLGLPSVVVAKPF